MQRRHVNSCVLIGGEDLPLIFHSLGYISLITALNWGTLAEHGCTAGEGFYLRGWRPDLDKPLWLLTRKERRERTRQEWRQVQEARNYVRNPGTHGPASDVRVIDPRTGEVVGTIPRKD